MKVKEFAESIGIPWQKVCSARRKITGQTGDLAPGEDEALRDHFFPEEELEDPVAEALRPQIIHGMVHFARPDSRRVGVAIMEDGERHDVVAFVDRNCDPTKIRGKMQKWEWIEHEGKRYYRHISLANKAWASIGIRIGV